MNVPSSNPYFDDLFSNTSDLIHFANLEGIIEIVNPAWLFTLGYSVEEVIGTSIYDYIWQDGLAEYKSYRDRIVHDRLDDIQVTLKKKNGQPVFLEGHIRAFYNNFEVLHFRGVFRDITLKKKKQIENDEQFSKINNFLKNAPDAVVVINEKQLIVEWNLKAEAIFGYTKEQALNQPLSELIIPLPYRKMHTQGMEHFLNTGEGPVLNRTIEVSAIDKNQVEFPISLNISNVKLNNEWFFIAFMEDITERKKQQEELFNQKIELNAVKQEDKKNKEFLNIASHELKTPLTSVKAFAQLALRGLGERPIEETGQYLRKIDEAANKLQKLVADLLDISKINAGKLKISKEPIQYGGYLEEVVNNSRIIFPTHDILITTNEDAFISLDPIRIEQVIINLISNAVKYSPDAEKIEIRSMITSGKLITSVKDFGIGIEKGNADKVFDRFFQIQDISKSDNSGLGLGLFISSEIIKHHDGVMWVESTPGEGTVFYFALPLSVSY